MIESVMVSYGIAITRPLGIDVSQLFLKQIARHCRRGFVVIDDQW